MCSTFFCDRFWDQTQTYLHNDNKYDGIFVCPKTLNISNTASTHIPTIDVYDKMKKSPCVVRFEDGGSSWQEPDMYRHSINILSRQMKPEYYEETARHRRELTNKLWEFSNILSYCGKMLIKLILEDDKNKSTPSVFDQYTDKSGNRYIIKAVSITRTVDKSIDRKLRRDEWIVPSINAFYINDLLSCFYEYDHWSSYSNSIENIDFYLFGKAIVNTHAKSGLKPITLGDFI